MYRIKVIGSNIELLILEGQLKNLLPNTFSGLIALEHIHPYYIRSDDAIEFNQTFYVDTDEEAYEMFDHIKEFCANSLAVYEVL